MEKIIKVGKAIIKIINWLLLGNGKVIIKSLINLVKDLYNELKKLLSDINK